MTALFLTPPRLDVIHAKKTRERTNEQLRAEMSIDQFEDKSQRRQIRRERGGE